MLEIPIIIANSYHEFFACACKYAYSWKDVFNIFKVLLNPLKVFKCSHPPPPIIKAPNALQRLFMFLKYDPAFETAFLITRFHMMIHVNVWRLDYVSLPAKLEIKQNVTNIYWKGKCVLLTIIVGLVY